MPDIIQMNCNVPTTEQSKNTNMNSPIIPRLLIQGEHSQLLTEMLIIYTF